MFLTRETGGVCFSVLILAILIMSGIYSPDNSSHIANHDLDTPGRGGSGAVVTMGDRDTCTKGSSTIDNDGCEIPEKKGTRTRSDITVDGDLTDWTLDDVVYIDPCTVDRYYLGDGGDDGRDLVAAYARMGADEIFFRLDLLDLAYGAESGKLDVYVLLDIAPGGEEWLPDYTECMTDSPWEIAVALYDSDHHAVYYSDWSMHNDTFGTAAFHSQFDSVEFSLGITALTDNGYTRSGDIGLQFFTTKDGTNWGPGEIEGKADVTDAIPDAYPWDTGTLTGTVSVTGHSEPGSAKVGIFHHGNQFIKNVDDFVEDGSGLGFIRVPEIHEKWNVPVNLHVSGTLAEGAQWFEPGFNGYMRSLVDLGIVHMVGGFYNEYIPQYVPREVNLWSMEYAREMIGYYYNDTDVPFCWMPERVFWDGYEDLVEDGGYRAVMVDTEDGFIWYAEPDGYTNEHKLYEEDNGLEIMFISNRGRSGAGHNIQDQIHNNHDGGLSYSLRQLFVGMARSPDQEQYTLYMDDWEKTCGNIPLWGGPEVVDRYENSISWMAVHPWIDVRPLESFLDWTPAGEVDVNDCTYFWLSGKTGSLNDPLDDGNLYDAWYSDPRDEVAHVSYFDYVPADCSMNMGDFSSQGTIIGDTWSLVSQIPDTSPLHVLAMKTFSAGLYETAWFEGEWPDIYIPYWQKEQAAHVRCAAIYYYANEWLEASDGDRVSVESVDLDLDGRNEFVISNEHSYCVFERRGGKLVLAVDGEGHQIVGTGPAGWLDEGDAVTDAVTATTSNTHYSGEYLGMAESAGEEYLEGSKTYSFSDLGHENELYDAYPDPNSNSVTFTLGHITKTMRLDGKKVSARYSVGGGYQLQGMRFSFSPDLTVLIEEGQGIIETVGGTGEDEFGWKVGDVTGAVSLGNGVEHLREGSNVASVYVELSPTASEFTAVLHLGEIDGTTGNTPPVAQLISPVKGGATENKTPVLRWEGADDDGDDISYTVLMDEGSVPFAAVAENIPGTAFSVPASAGLEHNRTYFWTVVPHDGKTAGTCISGIWNFTVTPGKGGTEPEIPIPAVEINSPENGSEVSGVVNITGTAGPGDVNGSIVSVEIDTGEGWSVVTVLTGTGGTTLAWYYHLDTTEHDDGLLVVGIRALDGNDRRGLVRLYLIVNNSAVKEDDDDNGGGDDDGGDDTDDDDDDDDDNGGGDDDGGDDTDDDDDGKGEGDDDGPGDNDTGGGGSTGRERQSKIYFNVTFMFVLPMLVIILAGVGIEILVERLRKKRGRK